MARSPVFVIGLVGLVGLASCGAAERDAPPSREPDSEEPGTGVPLAEPPPPIAPAPAPPDTLCLPVVSGCGCAYVCGIGRRRPDGRFDVNHDYQDSRVDEAALERRCFDAAGHTYPERGAPPDATRCIDVFYDLTPCGGECIPSTHFLDCVLRDGHCRPR
jgi:hypothetical protein